jgi:hypothetical protein
VLLFFLTPASFFSFDYLPVFCVEQATRSDVFPADGCLPPRGPAPAGFLVHEIVVYLPTGRIHSDEAAHPVIAWVVFRFGAAIGFFSDVGCQRRRVVARFALRPAFFARTSVFVVLPFRDLNEPEDIRSATLEEQQENKEYKPETYRRPARSMASSSVHSRTELVQQACWISHAPATTQNVDASLNRLHRLGVAQVHALRMHSTQPRPAQTCSPPQPSPRQPPSHARAYTKSGRSQMAYAQTVNL